MIDDMTSSDCSLNGRPVYSCLACHAKTQIPTAFEEEFDCKSRLNFLKIRIEARRGNRSRAYSRLSASYVIQEAAKRHFQLMEVTFEGLRGKFNEVDFEYLHTANWVTSRWKSTAKQPTDFPRIRFGSVSELYGGPKTDSPAVASTGEPSCATSGASRSISWARALPSDLDRPSLLRIRWFTPERLHDRLKTDCVRDQRFAACEQGR